MSEAAAACEKKPASSPFPPPRKITDEAAIYIVKSGQRNLRELEQLTRSMEVVEMENRIVKSALATLDSNDPDYKALGNSKGKKYHGEIYMSPSLTLAARDLSNKLAAQGIGVRAQTGKNPENGEPAIIALYLDPNHKETIPRIHMGFPVMRLKVIKLPERTCCGGKKRK